jgi:hypothetical protein
MTKETDTAAMPSRHELTIPIELLNKFKSEIRIFPLYENPKGYIIFDKEMLISVLEHGTDLERKEMVESLRTLDKVDGQLVAMIAPSDQIQSKQIKSI